MISGSPEYLGMGFMLLIATPMNHKKMGLKLEYMCITMCIWHTQNKSRLLFFKGSLKNRGIIFRGAGGPEGAQTPSHFHRFVAQ